MILGPFSYEPITRAGSITEIIFSAHMVNFKMVEII